MKKIKVSIPEYMALFYYPIALLFMGGISMVLILLAELTTNMWISIPLITISGLLQIVAFIACIYMLYQLGKSIIADEKKAKK